MSRLSSRFALPPQCDLARKVHPISTSLPCFVVAVKARGADDLAIARRDDERAAGRKRIGEEPLKHLEAVPVGHRMLRPDQWIASHRIQSLDVPLGVGAGR